MATQNFKRNLLLILYRDGEKNLTFVCFLLPLKREIKKCLLSPRVFISEVGTTPPLSQAVM